MMSDYSLNLKCTIDSWSIIILGEFKSVYVRNLPATVTEAEIEQEFKNFGRIKPDGIFVRVRKVSLISFIHGTDSVYLTMKR